MGGYKGLYKEITYNTMKKTISILEDFSEYPGLRHCSISDNSGEEFYHKVLNRAFKEAIDNNQTLVVDIDNTAGYAPSFLDEAFGNLVFDFTLDLVKKEVEIISNQEPSWKDMIEKETFEQWEQRRIEDKSPKVTDHHEAWYKYVNDQLESKVWLQPTA